MNRTVIILVILIVFLTGGAVMANTKPGRVEEVKMNGQAHYANITTRESFRHIVDHAAFKGFGRLILPRESDTPLDTPLRNVRSLMPYHSHVEPDNVAAALNHMIDEVNDGKTIYYSFYNEQQKRSDPTKEFTGLFFYRSAPGAPFAVVCPGGGFSYVGSLHEGFPLAYEICKKRYNAFVIRYRIGSQQKATEDLAAAVTFISRNAATLGVSTEDYSLWGGSAGARMVGNIALSGIAAFGGDDLLKPAAVVIAYTGQSTFSKDFSPTFMMVSEDDPIANVTIVNERVKNLRNAGVAVEYHRYTAAGHGFGLGTGTDAEGWLSHAIMFWEKQLSK